MVRYGERNPHLCGLPCIWLQSLLSRLEGDQQVFILRRSAGFAYSFVSLLRAEPSNYDSVLLPIAMSRLLNTVKLGLLADSTCRCSFGKSVSSDDMPESECSNIHSGGDNWRWKMAVHALNVLRLIISDGSTAVDEFISAATQYTIHGFKSSQWAVRNSCMMVFSSIIQKSVDRDKNNSGSITAATVTEYFRRFPELLPFLHKELLDIIVNLSTSGIESPSLYPLLLLISKLRSSVDDSVTCGGNNIFATLSEFEDILLQCHSCRSYRVREMAAKAYCAVVPLNRIPQKLQSLHVNYVACTITNGRHGLLMVIQQLLANLIRHCDLVSDMDAIMLQIRLDTVAKFMDLWIPLVVNISSNHDIIRVPATTIVWIKILEDVKFLSRDSSACQIIDQILFGTSQQILEKVKSINLANQHPFQQLLFERTLETLLNRLGSESKPVKGSATADRSDSVLSHENIVLALIPLLHHPLSELRKGVLNGLRNIVSLDRSTCQHIFKALQDRILLEKEPPIQNLALDLLLR